ncbi:spore germination protein [Virgibacillus ndiopensis]|uniref:spore germination protein n=1 Tax=Virgibacillus ndiopensis TaxID=2004408 RepID=UPI002481A1D6|nr:spore germination protein [Virgibacillus ndiopensis]
MEPHKPCSNINELRNMNIVIKQILAGNSILLIDDMDHAFQFHSAKSVGRDISELAVERSIRGPKEGFVEDIQLNLLLIRRKLQLPSLKVEKMVLGRQTNTQINIVYLKRIADEDIVREVQQRLSRIDIDGILDSPYIESMIKDSPKSPFPTMFSTERPDRVCGGLLDGKVAVLIDGTPFVLTVPALFVEFLHSSEELL